MGLVDLYVFSGEDASRAVEEAEELRVFVHLFYVVVETDYHVVATCCLPTRQHAAYSQRTNDGLSLLSCSEVDCLYPSFCCLREDGSNARRDLGLHLQALEEGLLQDLRGLGFVLGAICVKG